jgi:hypothetical protein
MLAVQTHISPLLTHTARAHTHTCTHCLVCSGNLDRPRPLYLPRLVSSFLHSMRETRHVLSTLGRPLIPEPHFWSRPTMVSSRFTLPISSGDGTQPDHQSDVGQPKPSPSPGVRRRPLQTLYSACTGLTLPASAPGAGHVNVNPASDLVSSGDDLGLGSCLVIHDRAGLRYNVVANLDACQECAASFS